MKARMEGDGGRRAQPLCDPGHDTSYWEGAREQCEDDKV